jgi:hypothetical protein
VDPTSVSDVANGILDCLKDSVGARRRAEAARRSVEELSPERMAGEYDAVYRDVLAKRAGARTH